VFGADGAVVSDGVVVDSDFCEAFGAVDNEESGVGDAADGAVEGAFWDASGEADAVESDVGDFWDASGEDDAVESGPGVSVAGAVEGSDCVGSFVYWSWEALPWANAVAPRRSTVARAAATVMVSNRPINPEDNLVYPMSLFP
jgi:hypothetical protein